MREVIITSNYHNLKDLTRKTTFLRGGPGLSSIIWARTGNVVEILRHSGKSVKLKVRTNSYVCRSFRGKTGRGLVFIVNRVNRYALLW